MHHSIANYPTGILLDIPDPRTGRLDIPFRKGLLTLRLPENGSTGYIWQVNPAGCGLSLLGDRREGSHQGRHPLIGRGGHRILVFRVEEAVVLRLHLERPWEKAAPEIVLEITLRN